jgi:hypothetical protein
MSTTNGRHYFLVSAQTSDPFVYYDSNVDSGYSVDNLSPSAPLNPGLTPLAINKVLLTWDKNRIDPDLAWYTVYRDTTSGFACDDSTELYGTVDSTVIDSTLQPRLSYYYRIVSVDIHGNESPPTAQLFTPSALTSRANIKLYLEGPYNTGTLKMHKTLNTDGYLAAHFGSIPIPSEAVDSINIELRNAASGPTTRKYRAAWLLTDGTIRDFADTTKSYVEFDTLAGSYHLVIHHRNHIAIMTAGTQALNGVTPAAYDFSTSQSQAYGTNPMKQVGAKFLLYAGDGNHSGIVSAADANLVFGALNTTGYSPHDINLSGIVSAADANMIFGNLNAATQVPSEIGAGPAAKEGNMPIPTEFGLAQNYPNPFNPSTMINYQLPMNNWVTLKVYDILGREVTTLVDGPEEPGYKSVQFGASWLASGVYLYRLKAGPFIETRKLVLVR